MIYKFLKNTKKHLAPLADNSLIFRLDLSGKISHISLQSPAIP